MNEEKKHILIVEDEPEIRAIYAHKLTDSGFSVLTAPSGKEGLAAALQHQPDLVLLDILMADLSGIEVLKQLRAHDEWGAHVPVILLTNVNPIEAMGEVIGKDVVDAMPTYYLVKASNDPSEVVAKISEVLAEPIT
ncbi:MAG: Two component transcriptional regulator [Candidatus Kaiserbacteria bacterium GW2011_GWB1_52_6]|uniref:Two component transcriptional regulator n=2 Tax=Candidatus Kaiseribacteriota TaxID=1752734 RepID=A0A0G1XHH7_9BACT|nr:MAG: Two component transcriptional regulator [Candidatus Kaiserbacteria bacterium GW2011_GWB1_52_6]KKW30683.1 MAG: Two component transcriptional regulator [Candidatus Kaiserbacteria bacterium GW2011_GWC2_52_8b]